MPETEIDFDGVILWLNNDGTLDYIMTLIDHFGGIIEIRAKTNA